MDAKLKADWVAALRSGKYERGVGALLHNNRFCCLGVLCDVSSKGQWDLDTIPATFVASGCNARSSTELADAEFVPNELRCSIGLSKEHHETCWKMNDEQRASFPAIADWIEANIPADTSTLVEA